MVFMFSGLGSASTTHALMSPFGGDLGNRNPLSGLRATAAAV